MNVRRLAAIDMYGTRGTVRRRRIILAEFVVGCVAALAIGVWVAVASDEAVGLIIGVLIIGIGLNYAPLSVYAIRFSQPGALDAELTDVDIPAELRRYSVWQMWVFLPLALVVFDLGYRRRVG